MQFFYFIINNIAAINLSYYTFGLIIIVFLISIFSIAMNLGPQKFNIKTSEFDEIDFGSKIIELAVVISLVICISKFIFFFNNIETFSEDFWSVYSIVIEFIMLFSSLLIVIDKEEYIKSKNFRHPILIYFFIAFIIGSSTWIIESRDLLTLYLSLEIQTLTFYLFIAFDKTRASISASVQYFVYSILSTVFFLFGITFIYGATGTINYAELYTLSRVSEFLPFSTLFVVGLFFIFFSLLFKLGLFPFHGWVISVYGLCDWFVLSFLSTVSKITAFNIFIQFNWIFNVDEFILFKVLFFFIVISSCVYGAFGGIMENNLKRLIGYASIVQSGFIFTLFIFEDSFARSLGILFIFVYIFLLIGVFSFIFSYRISYDKVNNTKLSERFVDIANISKRDRYSLFDVFMLAIVFFSFVGIPPLAGFFTKFYLVFYLSYAKYYGFILFILFISSLTSAYYLRFIKIIFDSIKDKETPFTIKGPNKSIRVFWFISVFNLFFVFCLPEVISFIMHFIG